MIQEADAVIVGAGAWGSSIAFHVAKMGKRNIVLADKYDIASQTSPRAAGLTGQVRTSPLMTRLAARSVKKIEQFRAETGQPITYHQTGSLKIARTLAHEEQLRTEVMRGREAGIEIDFVSLAEARRMQPFLEPVDVRAVTFVPSDLYLEPAQIPLGYAQAARRLGATVLPHTAITGIGVRNGRVDRVVTSAGEIRTTVVVDAAGAWTRVVAAMAGQDIALVPTRHQLLVTEPIAGVRSTHPIARVIDTNVYVRPEGGGLMLGGYEPHPLQFDTRSLTTDFQIADLPLDLGILRRLAETIVQQFPVFRTFEVREHRGGLPTMTSDGEHIVGPVPGVEGFFVASGCCVGGLSIAPAIGELVAEWIVSGAPSVDLARLSPARFGQWAGLEDWLKAQCEWQYSHHYWLDKKLPD